MAYIANKEYIIKVYRSGLSGAFIDTIYDFNWLGSGFRKQINGGLGNFTFQIPKKFDNYGQNDLVAINNQIKVYCVDIDSGPSGVLIYSGWIYSTQASINGPIEEVRINCYGNVTKGAKTIVKRGTNVILTTSANGLDTTSLKTINLEAAFKAVIDRYQAENTNAYFNYTSTSVGTTGVTLYYTFDKKMVNEALIICQQDAPVGWWWYVDENGTAWLQAKPTSPVHTFVFGKDFTKVDILDNADGIVNDVVFQSTGGGSPILNYYEDSASKTAYDARWEVRTDNRVTDATTANLFGKTALAANKNPIIRTTVTIVDNNIDPNGYNIEAIQPGQTCKFRGFNAITSQNFNDNMMIVAVDYTPGYAILSLEDLQDLSSRQIKEAQDTANIALGSNNVVAITLVP